MASRIASRYLLTKSVAATLLPRSYPSTFSLQRLRPLLSAATGHLGGNPSIGHRCFSTRKTSSSLNDPSPNWSNRPPKETILLDGCDFEHWLCVVEKPEGDPTRDEIIDGYIKTLAQVVGSEEEARMKIYSVSTRCYYAFGALVSEEVSYKIKELPNVRWVLPDSYLDVRNKDYGGEPFVNGQAVPYDPKYHEEWIRNNSRANERNRRNDRPRNFDRSRNFERRRQQTQNPEPISNMAPMPNNNMPPVQNSSAPGMGGGVPQPNNYGGTQQGNNMGGMQFNNRPGMNNAGGMAPNTGGVPPPNRPGMNNAGGMAHNMGGVQPPNVGWSNNAQGNMPNYAQNNVGWSGNTPGPSVGNMPNFQNRDAPNGGSMNHYNSGGNQAPKQEFQNNYSPAGNAPNYSPAGNTPNYGPAGNTPNYSPVGNMPNYSPAGNTPNYSSAGNTPNFNPPGNRSDGGNSY